ncbi:MAG: hypothetical protein RBR77_00650 [Thauera sp.]|jgi:uncharacterized membrane protein YedE/YeeE|nr:hypothetical protein [Thauera sp.]
MKVLLSLLVGLVFGLGLILSSMSNPAKVLGFLDLFGSWDPSLALVMGGAVGIGMLGFASLRKRSQALLGGPMMLPTARAIDRPLVTGSVVFGIGWGLGGICPGPGLVLVGSGLGEGVVFVVAMLAGMGLSALLKRRSKLF